MLPQRIISSLVGIPLLLAVVWQGGLLLFAASALLMVMAIWEISLMLKKVKLQLPMSLILLGCFILLATAYYYHEAFTSGAIVTIFILYLSVMVLLYPRFSPLNIAVAFTSTLYVGLFIYLYLISTLDHGTMWLILLLVCTWSGDTMAFFIGRQWGKRPVAPMLSPGKTIMGAIGGIAGSVTASIIMAYFYTYYPMGWAFVLGILIGLAILLGDLVESALKRQVGVKDSGKLIPGHGGILDRFDSILFTGPLVYYFVVQVIII